jgi:hypothetical protein
MDVDGMTGLLLALGVFLVLRFILKKAGVPT